MAASEKRIAEEVRNFPCLYDKGNRATRKKIGKRTHGLGWRMPLATAMLHKLNYKGNLDWLKRCSEDLLYWLYHVKRLLCKSPTPSSFHNKKRLDH